MWYLVQHNPKDITALGCWEDYTLVNDIIIDYVMNHIDNNRFNDLEDYVNTEMRSII